MKKIIFILFITFFTSKESRAQLPELNQKILEYVDSKMKKKVDRGECWDLANQAFIYANAKLVSTYNFGRKYNPKTEEILPGDVLQFSKVRTKMEKNGTTFYGSMMHHTAIVYKVIDENTIILAEQNGEAGRRVATTELILDSIVSGKVYFYRPIPI